MVLHKTSLGKHCLTLRLVKITYTIYILQNISFLKMSSMLHYYTIKKKMRKKLNGQLVSANNARLYNLLFFSVRGLHYCNQSINSCKLISTSLKIESKSRQKTWLQKSNKSQHIQTDYRVHIAPYINTEIIPPK